MTTPPVSTGLLAHQAVLSADSAASGWIMVSTVLVLLMSLPGLALFYGGMVRRKNVLATLAQTLAASVLAMILWALVGYSLAFAEGGSASIQSLIGGLDAAFLNGVGIQTAHKLAPGLPEPLWVAFQMTFAMITPAIIAGAFAERMKFSAFLLFTGLWILLVYAPVCHWVWGGGFLGAWGVLDFAGGAVVHINSGVAGLVCALMLGKRRGYGRDNLAPHNLVLTMIGGSLLFVGWIGFNAGSAWAADSIAAMALLNTMLAAATGVVGWVLPEWISRKKPTLLGMLSGLIAGLVGITPAAGFVAPGGAMAIGLLTGVACYVASTWLKAKFRYDDSLDAFGLHGIGGLVGAVLTAAFATVSVNALSGGADALKQLVGALVVALWSAVLTAGILWLCRLTVGLRVSDEDEVEGLDTTQHGEALHS